MVVKNGRPSNNGAQVVPPSLTVTQLLKTKQYDELAEFLDKARLSIQQNSELSLLSEILFAARQICLACSILEDEAEWHRWAAGEAEHRKHELERSLQTIADIISTEITRLPVPPAVSGTAIKKPSPGGVPLMNGSNHGLWQRLQNFLKSEPRLLRSVDEMSLVKLKQVAVPQSVVVSKTDQLPSVQVAVSVEPIAVIAQAKPAEAPAPAQPAEPIAVIAEARPAEAPAPAQPAETEKILPAENTQPSMVVYGLGAFQVHLNGQPIENWPNRKGKSIFKYLILFHTRPVAKEVLMECFWPDSDPEAARNNLNVAIYNLRQALRKVDTLSSHILFQDDCYLLNPDFKTWIDFEAFTEHYEKGQQLELAGERVQAVREYGVAETLYQGQLFEEDRYEDWPTSQRQSLQDAYLRLLDRLSAHYFSTENYTAGINVCNKMLVVDPCREDAHRLLMQCYTRQGQHYLALRQYHVCVEAHKKELDTFPSPETSKLYEQIRSNQTL